MAASLCNVDFTDNVRRASAIEIFIEGKGSDEGSGAERKQGFSHRIKALLFSNFRGKEYTPFQHATPTTEKHIQ